MAVKIKLKNRKDVYVKVDDHVYQDMLNHQYLTSIRFLENLRAHSGGYGVFQRCITTKKGPIYETIYLHKHIAEKYIEKPASDRKLLVRFKDEDVTNVTLENLEWVSMSRLRRQMRSRSATTGYRGVIRDRGKYGAIVYDGKKAYHLGFFATAEEAARAYNAKSIELFGITNSLNDV